MTSWREFRDALASLLQEESQNAYDDAPCGYLSTLPDGTILQLNRTFGEWLGYTPDELLGRRLQSMLSIGGQILWETHYAPLLAMQGYISEMAFDLKDGGGNVLPVLLSSRQRQDEAGVARLVKTVVFNATERRRYEQELLRERKRASDQAKAKAELLRMLSHDVRTPLSTILNIARLQATQTRSDAEIKQVRMLQHAAESVLTLVNQVLAAEQLEAGAVDARPAACDIRMWLVELVEPLRLTAEAKGVPLTCTISDSVPSVVAVDRVRLGQVLNNLIANAVKFTERGEVSVHVEALARSVDHARLAFKVRDTGIGMSSDQLAMVFEPFVQGTPDTARRYGGNGLGLAICQRILERIGSRLEVTSELGQGSSFRFNVPLSM